MVKIGPDHPLTQIKQQNRAWYKPAKRRKAPQVSRHNVGPGYWMYETGGALRPAVEAYLTARPLTEPEIATLRAYLRQWIASPLWGDVEDLRRDVDGLTSRHAIHEWLMRALDRGIDPL